MVAAEDPDRAWVEGHYTKSEFKIPMRDGVRLHTSVFTPKDDRVHQPLLLLRTPYGLRPYGSSAFREPEGSLASFLKDGFILVLQDVRGRNGSEGVFEHARPFNPDKRGPADVEDLFGALATYRAVEQQNPGITNLLVMGPWAHGEWGRGDGARLGHVAFRAKTAAFCREQIELPFFRHFLKGDTNWALPEAYVFETGTHQWRRFEQWPPASAVPSTLYLQADGRLGCDHPSDGEDASDEYDPDYPDPEPNPSGVRMGGYQQLVRGEPMRGRFRNSYERPEPFEPGKVTRLGWTMPDVFHTFRRGHRVMLQIQSTWFPLVDRNPQTFVDVWQAQPEDFQKAVQRVYRGSGAASAISFLALPRPKPDAGVN